MNYRFVQTKSRDLLPVTVVLTTLLLSGCMESRHIPILDIISGTLTTPQGDKPIHQALDISNPDAVNWRLGVIGTSKDLSVSFRVVSTEAYVSVITKPAGRHVKFLPERSLYKHDNDPPIPLVGEQRSTKLPNGAPADERLIITLPEDLAKINFRNRVRALSKGDRQLISKVSGVPHQLHFEWLLDDLPYAVDLVFELDSERVWYWMVPGTP